jgi:DNA-binding CsgD family transcriptional regulator
MRQRRWRLVLGYGALAATLLGCLHLISLAPPLWGWARELVGGAIAIVALGVGLKLASRRPAGSPPNPAAAEPPASSTSSARPSSLAPPTPPARPTGPEHGEPPAEPLTQRELQVLRLLCSGRSNKDIARALHLSENTVKTHLANVYAKLQVGKRTEAQARALRLGLVRPDETM